MISQINQFGGQVSLSRFSQLSVELSNRFLLPINRDLRQVRSPARNFNFDSTEEVSKMEPKYEQKTAQEAQESEFIEEFGRYVVMLERDRRFHDWWARITPTQGVFDVEVVKMGYMDYEDEYTGEISRGLGIAEYSKTLELTVEDVRKVLDQSDIKLPESLAEKLTKWQREFLESPEYADEMRMARAEAGDDIRIESGSDM